MKRHLKINQLVKIYQKSWSKAKAAKAAQNKYRKSDRDLAAAYADKAAYYVLQWLHLKKVLRIPEQGLGVA